MHTAHADVAAELYALRETAVSEATKLRALELERLDAMHAGLWADIHTGSPPAVSAGVRVSERRARLLGLDAPTTSRTEVSASRSLVMNAKLQALAAELNRFELDEAEELLRESERLFADAIARSKARRFVPAAVTAALPAARVENVGGAPAEPAIGNPATESPTDDGDTHPAR